jgi:hypothetical protein
LLKGFKLICHNVAHLPQSVHVLRVVDLESDGLSRGSALGLRIRGRGLLTTDCHSVHRRELAYVDCTAVLLFYCIEHAAVFHISAVNVSYVESRVFDLLGSVLPNHRVIVEEEAWLV